MLLLHWRRCREFEPLLAPFALRLFGKTVLPNIPSYNLALLSDLWVRNDQRGMMVPIDSWRWLPRQLQQKYLLLRAAWTLPGAGPMEAVKVCPIATALVVLFAMLAMAWAVVLATHGCARVILMITSGFWPIPPCTGWGWAQGH